MSRSFTTRTAGIVRRISGAIPVSPEDRIVLDALVRRENDGLLTGYADLVDAVGDGLARDYARLWYADGGLWGHVVARRRAASTVEAADGRLFETI